MNTNYNLALLKTIKEPLYQTFVDLDQELNEIKVSEKSEKDLNMLHVNNILGSLQMIGRSSLITVMKDVDFALKQLNNAQLLGWDIIYKVEIITKIQQTLNDVLQEIKLLEKGHHKLSLNLYKSWSSLNALVKKEESDIYRLFDPEQDIKDDFSPLDSQTLEYTSRPHGQKLNESIKQLEQINSAVSFNAEEWSDILKQIETVYDWTYALKHRLGYAGYWLACRARIAYELLRNNNKETTKEDRSRLILDIQETQIEFKKFINDNRKPKFDSLSHILYPLLKPWPDGWDSIYQSLTDVKEVFHLASFWEAVKNKDQISPDISYEKNDLKNYLQDLKIMWVNLTSNNNGDMKQFIRSLMIFSQKYGEYPTEAKENILSSLKMIAQHLIQHAKIDDVFAQEVATLFLFIEETLETNKNENKLKKDSLLIKNRIVEASYGRQNFFNNF